MQIIRAFQLITLVTVLLCGMDTQAQSVLDKQVSLTVHNIPVETVLELLEEQGGFVFSYSSDLVQGNEITSIQVENESLKSILKTILGNDLKYLERGSYVIIQEKKRPKAEKQKFELTGQLVDANTGEKISSATIYEVNRFKSTTSSETGFYNLSIKDKSDYLEVAIAKENYRDTILRLRRDELKDLIIELEPIAQQPLFENKEESTDTLALVKVLVSDEVASHMNNVSLYENRFAQFSFLPMLGTNKLMSGKTTNNVSFNLLAGYEYALNGIEVGGIANITRQHMNGAQIAGFGNIVGGKTRGVQIAGFFNVNKLDMKGIQLAGFSNTVANEFTGIQASGFVNVSPRVKGIQLAGFVNTAWSESKSHQFSGFANFAKTNSGSQLSGFINTTSKELKGVQVVGFVNYAKILKGVQIAGFVNVAFKEMHGVQISPFINYAGKLNGIQLGLINICDTVESGINVGLISFVRKGMHDLEINYSESMPANLLFKTGTNRFYNILALGYHFDLPIWSLGYGFGTRHQYKNGLFTGIEVQANQILNQSETIPDLAVNLLNQMHPFMGFKWSKEMGLSVGPVLNVYYSKYFNSTTQEFGHAILTNPFYDVTSNGANLKMSLGYRIALSF